jgi:flagellar motility protein MotE (MotC chaperone)/sporulation protein YlmC with PRC-barrel domain
MQSTMLYLTELTGLVVYDLRGHRIGRIRDAALVPLIDPSRVDRFLVGGGWSWLTIRHDQIASISLDGIRLSDEQLTPYHADEYMLRLVRDLLDQQIIDAHGRKVVRVTDVTFEVVEGRWLRVLEVDIGLRAVFRRLLQGVLPPKWIRKLQSPISINSIRWEFANIVEPDPQRRLRLNITTHLLEEMHPADLADIVEELGPAEREAIIEAMEPEAAAETLSEVEPEIQASILEALEVEKAAEILEEMAPDEAAAALSELEEATSAEILEEMEVEEKTEVRELLEFPDHTAGRLMTTEYVALPHGSSASDALERLRAGGDLHDDLNTLFIVDIGGHLTGVVPIARLLAAEPDALLASLSLDNAIRATVTASEEDVIELFDKYNVLTMPVVDEDGVLAGVITADDVITAIRQR